MSTVPHFTPTRAGAASPPDWNALAHQLRSFISPASSTHSLEGYLNLMFAPKSALAPQFDLLRARASAPALPEQASTPPPPAPVKTAPAPTNPVQHKLNDTFRDTLSDSLNNTPSNTTPKYQASPADAAPSAKPLPPLDTSGAPPPSTKPPSGKALGQVFERITTDQGSAPWISNGGVSRDNSLGFSGTAERGVRIDIYDGKRKIGQTFAAPETGRWSFSSPELADGQHQFTFQFVRGTESSSQQLNTRIDTHAPSGAFDPKIGTDTGAISHISSGASTQDRTLNLSGTAEPHSRVTLYDGNTVLTVLKADAQGQWRFTTPKLALGEHQFSALIRDEAGNESRIPGVSAVIKPALPPVLGSVNPQILTDSGAIAHIFDGGVTKDQTIAFSGKVVQGGKVAVYDGNTLLGYGLIQQDTWSFTTPQLGEGKHQFNFKFSVGDQQTNHTLQATVDTQAPVGSFSPLLISDSGAIASGDNSEDRSLVLSGLAEPGSLLKIFDGQKLLGSLHANAEGHWTFTTKDLSLGQHSFSVLIEDSAGNKSEATGPSVHIVDSVQQPSATLTPPPIAENPPAPPPPVADTTEPDAHQPDTHNWSKDSGWGQIDALAALRKVSGKELEDVQASNGTPWAIASSNINDAWHHGYTGKGVTVAVIDSGLDTRNSDLTQNLSKWSWDFIDNDANVMDEKGHGTFVASEIIAANNGVGLTGAAYDAELMALRVLDKDGHGSIGNVAKALRYAVDHGADVVNLSLGSEDPNAALEQALQYAQDHNVLVVAAAGNEGSNQLMHPASYAKQFNNVVAVGASAKTATGDIDLADFSNRAGDGPYNYVAAAGKDVLGYGLDGNINAWQGSSMAAPYASAVAALLLSADSKLSAADLANTLNQTAFGI